MHSLTHSLTHSLAPYRPKLEVQEIRGRAQGHTGHQRPAGTWGVGRVSTFQCNDCCLLVGRIRWYPANSMQQSVVNSSFGWLVSPGCQAHCRERFAHDRRGDAAEAFRTVIPLLSTAVMGGCRGCFVEFLLPNLAMLGFILRHCTPTGRHVTREDRTITARSLAHVLTTYCGCPTLSKFDVSVRTRICKAVTYQQLKPCHDPHNRPYVGAYALPKS